MLFGAQLAMEIYGVNKNVSEGNGSYQNNVSYDQFDQIFMLDLRTCIPCTMDPFTRDRAIGSDQIILCKTVRLHIINYVAL